MHSDSIQQKIFEVRGTKVMLDFDLASIYEVETKVLNQAVKRNINRFPGDFMFQLTEKEWELLFVQGMRSQIVTASVHKRNKQYLPFAFTEHGVTMLASVLRSEKAVSMNILIVRAFIALRQIAQQYKDLAEKLAKLENSNKKQFGEIYQALNFLIEKKQQEEDFSKRRRIGFNR
jgi:tRNA isopentenyl-2-thiomethyl-A-37 hydroxylase MiaE